MPNQGNIRRLLYMYGAVSQVELNGVLEATSIDEENVKSNIKARWREASKKFQQLSIAEAGLPETVQFRPIDAAHDEYLSKLQEQPVFSRAFSNYPISVEEVEIDKLVAAQRTVHIDYVEHLKTKFTVDQLLPFCLEVGSDDTPIIAGRTAQNTFTFSSENPGLRMLDVVECAYDPTTMRVAGGQPVRAVVIQIGYGTGTVNVYRVGNRAILNNGFHRLYALRSAGVSHAPVLVQHVTNPELELPAAITELPRDYVVKAPRPGIMRDFFDTDLICEIRQRDFIRTLQIGWAANPGITPR